MTSPPEPPPGVVTVEVDALLERAGLGAGPVLVVAPPHASFEPLVAAASDSGAVVVAVPRTPLADPFAPLWSALGHRLEGSGILLASALAEALDGRLLVVVDLDRADGLLVDLVAGLSAPVLATTNAVVLDPNPFDVVEVAGWGRGREVPAVDRQAELDRLIADDPDALQGLITDWLVRGEPTDPSDGLAMFAASVASPDELRDATARAAEFATGVRRVTLLQRLGDPRAPTAARQVLESFDPAPDAADRLELHRLAASDLAPTDARRPAHVIAAAGAALVLGRHDDAEALLDDELVATDDNAALLLAELHRRLERPELDDTLDRAAGRSALLEALATATTWLPGRPGHRPVDVASLAASGEALARHAPGSIDVRVRAVLLREFVDGAPDDRSAPTGHSLTGASTATARDVALGRLGSGIVGLHRSLPPSQVIDVVGFAADPAAGTGMSALALAHLAVAFGDAGRSSEALALLDEPARSGRFTGRALPESLVGWALAEVEFAAGRPARAARVGERRGPVDPLDEADPLPWLLQLVLDWSAVETRRPAVDVVGGDSEAHGIVVAAPVERAAIAHVGNDEHREAVDGFLAAEALWRGRHDRGALRCCWAAGESARLADDLPTARDLLRRAETEAAHLGSLPMLSRVRQSLRRAGVRATASGAAGIGPLSGREVDVLRLVGAGRSSIDIGVQLGVAKSTVETQISSAMLKLNAATRLQAAAMLREMEES